MSGTRAFQAEERTCAKAVRPENAWCVQDTRRRPVWSDPRDYLWGCGWEESFRGEADTEPWQAMRGRLLSRAWSPPNPTITSCPKGLFLCFASVQFNHSVVSNSLQPHGLQHARPPCPSPTARVYSNACPLSRWCHPTIPSSVIPFFSRLQSFPASGSFEMSQLFASDGQSIWVSVSASVLPMNTQDWSPLGWTGWISLQSKGLSRLFSNTTAQKHHFFSTQPSL